MQGHKPVQPKQKLWIEKPKTNCSVEDVTFVYKFIWKPVKDFTVKLGYMYSEHAYNELRLTVKWFWFPVGLLHVVI